MAFQSLLQEMPCLPKTERVNNHRLKLWGSGGERGLIRAKGRDIGQGVPGRDPILGRGTLLDSSGGRDWTIDS